MTVIVQLLAIRRLSPGLVVPTSCLRLSEGGLDGSGHGECRLIRKHYGAGGNAGRPAFANIKTLKNCLPGIRKHSIRKVMVHSTVLSCIRKHFTNTVIAAAGRS
jgi:hypothetical protein